MKNMPKSLLVITLLATYPIQNVIALSDTVTQPQLVTNLTSSNKPLIIGYYPNWVTYDQNYQPGDIPKQVDEIAYAFAQAGDCAPPYATDSNPNQCNKGAQNSGTQDYLLHSTDPYSDFNANWGRGNMGKVLKSGKKVLLSIGGWTLSTPLRSAIDQTHQQAFIKSIIDFLIKAQQDASSQGVTQKFAGVDIDWEPNGNNWTEAGPGQLTKIDLTNYLTFLQKLKLELTRAKDKGQIGNDILRIAITANPKVLAAVDKTYGNKYWAAVANTVNSIDLMTYDFHGADFDAGVGYTNFNSPLYYDPAQPSAFGNSAKLFNTNASIIQMMNYAGVPATKLIIGVPAYGRAYRLTAFNTQTPYIAYDTQELVPGPRQDSLYTYREIMLTKSNNQKSTNTDFSFKTNYYSAGQAYAVGNYSSNNSNYPVFISYDNFITAQNKMKFVAQNQLAGVIIWSLDGDFYPQDNQFSSQSIIAGLASAQQ